MDDACQRYVVQAKPVYSAYTDCARQLAALLILQASSVRPQLPEHPMLQALQDEVQALREALSALQPSPRAVHFHRHLLAAERALQHCHDALLVLRRPHQREQALDQALLHVKTAWQHLSWAARALPGFESIDLNQACCASGCSGPH